MTEGPEHGSSARASTALAEAVTHLPWLSPGASALATLGRPLQPDTWSVIRADPGAVVLVLRHFPYSPPARSLATCLRDPAILEEALHHLRRPPCGFVDWSDPDVRPVYLASLTCARLASRLAKECGRCDPEAAWVCGLLAALGWLGVCAVDPNAAAACLAAPDWPDQPKLTQARLWGLDQSALARRLARRWRLPGWVASVSGCLGLPVDVARASFGADPVLFHVTRLALGQARNQGMSLGLVSAQMAQESALALGLSLENPPERETPVPPTWQSPYEVPLLTDLLAAAAGLRGSQDHVCHSRLEQELDEVHHALEEQASREAERLEEAKLTALAEFAAGAGHEINNPLAVISGQAQYLLGHEAQWFPGDPDGRARKALQVIVAQARRIHGVLRDLMQFARPTPPNRDRIDLVDLMRETTSGLADLAGQKRVRLELPEPGDRPVLWADVGQVKAALTCLIRNALEAAPVDGWARIRLVEPPDREWVEVAVEDNGPGPDPALCTHLFNPFYSGRSAGRGRGLGLPTAWRLARLQGGEVRLDQAGGEQPTRFLLRLPRSSDGAVETPAPPLPTATEPKDTPVTVGTNGIHHS